MGGVLKPPAVASHAKDKSFMQPIAASCALAMLCLSLVACTTTPPLDANAPTNPITPEGTIRQWVVLGSLPNPELAQPMDDEGVVRKGYHIDYLKSLGGESAAAFGDSQAVVCDSEAGEITLTAARRNAGENGKVNLQPLATQPGAHVAYAFCYLHSPIDQTVYAHFGSDDSAKIWLNGRQVLAVWTLQRGTHAWDDNFTLDLKKGLNPLLVKIDDRGGGWDFLLQIYDKPNNDRVKAQRLMNAIGEWQLEIAAEPADGELPTLQWQNADILTRHVGPLPLNVRWFDATLAEIDAPTGQPPYLAYGETTLDDARVLRRAFIWPSDSDPPSEDAEQLYLDLKRKLLNWPAPVELKRPAHRDQPTTALRTGTPAEAGFKDDIADKLRAVCTAWENASGKPFTAVVARNGVVVFNEAFGLLDGQPVTTGTRYPMASITKTLTAQLFAMFMDQGLLDLDEPVGKYLADHPTAGDKAITFRMCYTFTSSLRGHRSWGGIWNPWLENSVANELPNLQPGKKSRYNGDGHNLAAKAMEAITGKTIFRLMDEHYFHPMGMRDVPLYDCASSTQLSAIELAQLSQIILNGGSYGELDFYSPATRDKLLPQPIEKWYPDFHDQRGIGLYPMGQFLGPNTVGGAAASSTVQKIDLDNGLVVAIGRVIQGKDFDKYHAEFMKVIMDSLLEPAADAGDVPESDMSKRGRGQ